MKRPVVSRFQRRPVAVFAAVCLLISCVLFRIARLQTGTGAQTASAGQKYVRLGVSRGYIYDRDLKPLVNTGSRGVAVVLVNDLTRSMLPADGGGIKKDGVCLSFVTDTPVEATPFSTNVRLIERYASPLCVHLIGYTDADGRGVCGVERSFDRILNDAGGSIGVAYSANGQGSAIAGTGIATVDDGYNDPAGVVLTVDKEIQRIAEDAAAVAGLRTGAVVVLDVSSAEILASVSVPAYRINDLASSLNDPKKPFLNRALAAYPVGSAFKPFVAAAALENGVVPADGYLCRGAVDICGQTFRCYNSTSHGAMDLSLALVRSCNCYFIALGLQTGAAALLRTASAFGFGREVALTNDIVGASGRLPKEDTLTDGALALLSFGQGELLASPMQMAAAFAALANGGVYRAPVLMKALVDEKMNEYAFYKNETEGSAASEETCRAVSEGLRRNMLEGTGKKGASELFASAGKTATAQTGRFDENGNELLCTWFCGFFPYEDPRFVVVVFSEDGASAAETLAPLYKTVSEGIWLAQY